MDLFSVAAYFGCLSGGSVRASVSGRRSTNGRLTTLLHHKLILLSATALACQRGCKQLKRRRTHGGTGLTAGLRPAV